jgi:Predicted transcriptional regulators
MIEKQKLPSLEEAFNSTLYGAVTPDSKQVVMLDPQELIEITDQPFRVYTPERLAELAEDIKENGQISPCLVRQLDGKKIILAGRNRKEACEIAGVKVACILVECDDATADLILVNSNLNQRQELLPSEKAFAYKLQKEAYEAKGQRKSTAAVAEQNDENIKMIQRYIKLTDLIRDLLDMVDSGRIPVMAGVEISYMDDLNMYALASFLKHNPDQKVSGQQAQELREYGEDIQEFEYRWLKDFFDCKLRCTEDDSDEEDTNDEPTEPAEKKPPKKPTSVSIKLKDLEQIPCRFNFDEGEPDEIKEFIINSLIGTA